MAEESIVGKETASTSLTEAWAQQFLRSTKIHLVTVCVQQYHVLEPWVIPVVSYIGYLVLSTSQSSVSSIPDSESAGRQNK